MDKSKIVPEIHRYMVCDLQAPMMLKMSFTQEVTPGHAYLATFEVKKSERQGSADLKYGVRNSTPSARHYSKER